MSLLETSILAYPGCFPRHCDKVARQTQGSAPTARYIKLCSERTWEYAPSTYIRIALNMFSSGLGKARQKGNIVSDTAFLS